MPMDEAIEQVELDRVVEAIDALWKEGCPVARRSDLLAPAAIRRWRSSARRRVPQDDQMARRRDLAKGLMARFEQDPGSNLLRDYECVADRVASVVAATDDQAL